jgi:hypothetical protein
MPQAARQRATIQAHLVEALAKVEDVRLFDRQAEEDVANFFHFPLAWLPLQITGSRLLAA